MPCLMREKGGWLRSARVLLNAGQLSTLLRKRVADERRSASAALTRVAKRPIPRDKEIERLKKAQPPPLSTPRLTWPSNWLISQKKVWHLVFARREERAEISERGCSHLSGNAAEGPGLSVLWDDASTLVHPDQRRSYPPR